MSTMAQDEMPGERRGAQFEAGIIDLIASNRVRIPPYPAVAFRVTALIRQPNFEVQDLALLISGDQRLSADVLRVANSAAYGLTSAVSSVRAAVIVLGARNVASLALASGLGAVAHSFTPLTAVKRGIWQESVTSALLSQTLAEGRGLPGSEAFTAGLLHDFGRIVVAQTLEQLLESGGELNRQPLEVWLDLIDRFHVEVGLVVATRWNLSRLLCDAMSLHHGSSLAGSEHPELLDVIMTVDDVVAVASGLAGLTERSLEGVKRLRSTAERQLMVKAYPQCPELIASFETGEGGPEETSVARPDEFVGLKPVQFQVVTRSNVGLPFQAVAIGPNALVIEGPAPLPVNRLVQLTLQSPGRVFDFWANPVTSRARGNLHRIELRPFALNGAAFQFWSELNAATEGA